MEEPLVSIVCAVFNHGPFLRNALDGFLNQQVNFPFEILVHEDASTDNSAEIIRDYETKYPPKTSIRRVSPLRPLFYTHAPEVNT